MIQYVIDFLSMCPFLSDCLLTADFLGADPCHIGVFAQAANPVIERYADGGLLKQFVFRLSFRCSNHEMHPDSASRLWEQVGSWLEQQEALPSDGDGFVAQRFEIIKTGAPAERDYSTNRYDMDCRLIYYLDKW